MRGSAAAAVAILLVVGLLAATRRHGRSTGATLVALYGGLYAVLLG